MCGFCAALVSTDNLPSSTTMSNPSSHGSFSSFYDETDDESDHASLSDLHPLLARPIMSCAPPSMFLAPHYMTLSIGAMHLFPFADTPYPADLDDDDDYTEERQYVPDVAFVPRRKETDDGSMPGFLDDDDDDESNKKIVSSLASYGEGTSQQESGDQEVGVLEKIVMALMTCSYRALDDLLTIHKSVDLDVCLPGSLLSPLMFAAEYQRNDILARLLAAGAWVDLQDPKHGKSALSIACEKGNLRAVSRLSTLGANSDITDKRGRTPLMIAAGAGHRDIVALLLAQGANVNATDGGGHTALFMAASTGQSPDIIDLLVSRGADVNLSSEQGVSPLMVAVENGWQDTVDVLLRQPGLDLGLAERVYGHTALMMVVQSDQAHLMMPLVKRHTASALNVTDKLGRTALMHAAIQERPHIASVLLGRGAACDEQDHQGRTALHYAAERGCLKFVIELLAHRANPNKQDSQGHTPLMLSLLSDQVLTSYQILRCPDYYDLLPAPTYTALMIAADRRQRHIFAELLRRSIAHDSSLFQKARNMLLS